MSRPPQLPPKYVNVSSRAVYDKEMPKSVLVTYIRLKGLAWQNGGLHTPLLPIGDLFEITGLERRSFYQHLRWLKEMGWLRSESPRPGHAVLYFNDPADEEPPVQKNALPLDVVNHSKTLEEEEKGEEQHHVVFDSEGGVGGDAAGAEICTALVAAGVAFSQARRLVRRYPAELIRLKLDVYRQALRRGAAEGVGWLVDSIREGWETPAWYEPDPDSEFSRRRYLGGEFAAVSERQMAEDERRRYIDSIRRSQADLEDVR